MSGLIFAKRYLPPFVIIKQQMFQEQLLENLEEISKILDESFDATYGCYHCQNPPSSSSSNTLLKNQGSPTTIINNNFGSSSYPFGGYSMPIYYPMPVSQTIIYDSSTKKAHIGSSSDNNEEEPKKTKSLSRSEVVAGAGGIGVVLLGSAYILSQDEYIKLYLSKIDETIKSIKTHAPAQSTGGNLQSTGGNLQSTGVNLQSTDTFYQNDVETIIKKYDKWMGMYQKRTLGKCQAKLAGTGSLVTGIGGFMLYSNAVLFGGLFGGIACSGYLLWKYMTDNLRREKDAYTSLRNDIIKLNDLIKTEKNNVNPSAPPLFDPNAPPSYDEAFNKDCELDK